jgi:hypothetical protein
MQHSLVRTDDDLAREINTEHGHVETYKHNTIRHAIRCGELLLEMKQRVGHGNWLAWVEEHFEASQRTARNYMEIAKSAAVADLGDDTTMRSALRAPASPSQAGRASSSPRTHGQSKVLANGPGLGRGRRADPRRRGGPSAENRPGKTHQCTWAGVPHASPPSNEPSEAAGNQLDDHRAGEALYRHRAEAPGRDRPGSGWPRRSGGAGVTRRTRGTADGRW